IRSSGASCVPTRVTQGRPSESAKARTSELLPMPGAPQRKTGRTTATLSRTSGSCAGVTEIADSTSSLPATRMGRDRHLGDPNNGGSGVGPLAVVGGALLAGLLLARLLSHGRDPMRPRRAAARRPRLVIGYRGTQYR